MIKFIATEVTIDAAAGEGGRREITGIAVPYDVAATVSGPLPEAADNCTKGRSES